MNRFLESTSPTHDLHRLFRILVASCKEVGDVDCQSGVVASASKSLWPLWCSRPALMFHNRVPSGLVPKSTLGRSMAKWARSARATAYPFVTESAIAVAAASHADCMFERNTIC